MFVYRYQSQYPNGRIVYAVRPSKSDNDRYFAHHYFTSEKEDSKELFVNTVGHQKSWPTRNYPLKISPCAILHYVISGHGMFNGENISAGQFFITFPHQEHSIIQDPYAPLEFYWISFSGSQKHDLLKKCEFKEESCVQSFDFAAYVISRFDEIIYESHPEVDTELHLMGLLYDLLARHKVMNQKLIDEQPAKNDFLYYKKALLYINSHYREKISTSDIAKHLNISTPYVRLIFQKYCQYSPTEMILFTRFEQAKIDLMFKDYSIKEVAARAGYEDQSLFSRLFKKQIGESPSEYRKRKT